LYIIIFTYWKLYISIKFLEGSI